MKIKGEPRIVEDPLRAGDLEESRTGIFNNEFHHLTDDEVGNLTKVTRNPGGTIPNPAPVVAGAPALPPIPNPGILSIYVQKTTTLSYGTNLKNHNVTNNYSSPSTYLT